MKEYIEYLGNNPKEEMGFMGPFEPMNDMYGSFKTGQHHCYCCKIWCR